MPDLFETCEQAARLGGETLLRWRGRFKTHKKAEKDLVTEADFASQEAIRQFVLGRFPDHEFVGEESVADAEQTQVSNSKAPKFRWIVDPLDGTANYVRDLPAYAVSVALEIAGEVAFGSVFDPTINECYSAVSGKGAWLNGQRIRVSNCSQLSDAMIAASFAANVEKNSVEIRQFVEMLLACQSLRRLGSAALNLCYLAAGRMDGYWSVSCKAWDVAAGVLIVREAGGIVTAPDGTPFDLNRPVFAATANATLHREFLRILETA